MDIVGFGFLSALGVFILLWKINLEFFALHHWQTDLAFTGVMTWLFFGTFSGMATAVVAGIFFSVLLFLAKWILDI